MRQLLPFLLLSLVAAANASAQQHVIGPSELFHIKETNAFWRAKVTDSLEHCVIHAQSIAILNTSFPKEKNISKEVSFKAFNEQGEGRTVNSVISGVADYNGKQHYTVELEAGYGMGDHREYRKVAFILADLGDSPIRAIIGRSWLGADFNLRGVD